MKSFVYLIFIFLPLTSERTGEQLVYWFEPGQRLIPQMVPLHNYQSKQRNNDDI